MGNVPVDVAVKGFTGTAGAAGVWTIVIIMSLTIAGYMIRAAPRWRELGISERRGNYDGMSGRIDDLEARLDRQTTFYEAKLDSERANHGAEIASMRHRMNNLDQCLTMLLMLIEQDPDKAREAATRVRSMRERQEANESAEKAAIGAAKIVASGGAPMAGGELGAAA